jgi:hypothetical protein
VELAPLLEGFEQPLFADQRVHEDDAPDKQERILDRPPSARAGAGGP